MESRVYWRFVICYVACILHKNALGGSTSAKVFMSINDTFQPDVGILKTDIIQTVQSSETETRYLKDNWSKFGIPLQSSKNLSEMKSDFLKARCSRYCIQQVETAKNNGVVEGINLFLSFAENECKKNKNLNIEILHDFLLGNNSNTKREKKRDVSINNKSSTNISNCQEKRLKYMHKVNLSEYTETNFYIDANVTEIVISILGNLSRAILTISTKNNTEMDVKIINKGTQSKATNISKIEEFNNSRTDIFENISNNRTNIYTMSVVNSEINRRPKFARLFKRSAEIMDKKKQNNYDKTMIDDISDVSSPPVEYTIAKSMINYPIFSVRNNTLTSYGDTSISQSTSKNSEMFNGKVFALEQQQKIQPRSSEIASLNEDDDANDNIYMKPSAKDNVFMQIIQSNDQNFLTEFDRNIGDTLEKRKILLEVDAKSNLIATPGTTHRVLFDVTNNCVLPVRYLIRVRSSPFRILSGPSFYLWLGPGQTINVPVDIAIPLATQDTVNTLTLLIDGTQIPEKTVYIYVQSAISKNVDDIKPTLEYWFNSNCAGKLDKDRCDKTFWSADIRAQDYDSGLKRVISTPNGLYSQIKFVSGTKDRVTFYYLSTCCSTTATITAIDIYGNEYSRTVDVTAWDNLSQGEIAAIVLGSLLLLFLIILLIIAIVYCVRRRNSHDLPYTQRYGSRPPARSERTSF